MEMTLQQQLEEILSCESSVLDPEDAEYLACIIVRQLDPVHTHAPELLAALENANTLITQLLPGVKYIALQDYGFLNDTLLQMTAAIQKARKGT